MIVFGPGKIFLMDIEKLNKWRFEEFELVEAINEAEEKA